MPTITPFTPSPLAAFQFSAVLDDNTYTVIITWNVYRQGWYIGIYQQNGVPVVFRALIASPPDYSISMTAGYFNSTLVFLDDAQQFVVSP